MHQQKPLSPELHAQTSDICNDSNDDSNEDTRIRCRRISTIIDDDSKITGSDNAHFKTEEIKPLNPPENCPSRDPTDPLRDESDGNKPDGPISSTSILKRCERIPTYLRISAIVSTFSLLLTAGFLTFLWNVNVENSIWSKIVLTNWMAKSVTLSAVVLRVSVSVQAGIVTSMLASLIIETSGAWLSDVPEISAMRFSNGGPHILLWIYRKHARPSFFGALLTTLLLSTLAAQFSSTLLLSDVSTISIIGAPSLTQSFYGFDAAYWDFNYPGFYGKSIESDYWNYPTMVYTNFAVYTSPAVKHRGVDDTGKVLRAVHPVLRQGDREKVANYEGPAFVFDARVVCVQPNVILMENCRDSNGDEEYGKVCGKVAPFHSVADSVLDFNGSDFKCELPSTKSCSRWSDPDLSNPLSCSTPDDQWTVCPFVSRSAGGLISALDPTNNASLQHYWYPNINAWAAQNGNFSWPVDLGGSYLVFNTTSGPPISWDGSKFSPLNDGPWAEYQYQRYESEEIRAVHASLCYDALSNQIYLDHMNHFSVTMKRRSLLPELVTTPEINRGVIDTSDIQIQLGVGSQNLNHKDRGIFDLHADDILSSVAEQQSQWSSTDFKHYLDPQPSDLDQTYPFIVSNASTVDRIVKSVTSGLLGAVSLQFCLYCRGTTVVGPLHASLFLNTLADTGSPALALQAFLTTGLLTEYNNWLPFFDAKANATTAFFVERLTPVTKRGYWVVMGILAIHIAVSITVTCLFLKKTSLSVLGNAWPSFAPLASSDVVQSLLGEGTLKTDKDISREIKENGELRRRRYRVVPKSDGAGVTLAPVPDSNREK